jgi:hypothetical protein
VSDRRLAQARRAIENRVIERFLSLLRRFDTNAKGLLHPLLTDILRQTLRSEHVLHVPLFIA